MKPITVRFWVPDTEDVTAYLRDAEPLRDGEQLTEEQIVEVAAGIEQRAYYATVRDIVEDLKRAIKDGDVTDEDGATDWLHETIDGHHDVIYTSCAQDIVRISSNSGAYVENFGPEGMVKDGDIQWSLLAYCALEADVLEEIGDISELFATADEGEEV
jgi:hypothetical protein